MRFRLFLVLATSTLVLSSSCNQPTPSPSRSQAAAIPISNLGTGFLAKNMVLAAPSLPDLLGLVHGLHSQPTFDLCNGWVQLHAEAQHSCWTDIRDPGNALFIAAQVLEACLSAKSVTASLNASNTLMITVVSYGQCQPGSGSQALPVFSLLAIPLADLPVDEITVRVEHRYLSGSEPFYGQLRQLKTVVDLRRPLDRHSELQVRMAEVGSSIGAAQAEALHRLAPDQTPYPVMVGTNRWTDDSLGCPAAGQTYKDVDARGFVIYLTWLGEPPNSAVEYHVAGSTVAYCGRVSY